MADSGNRTDSGAPSATARAKFGGKDGSFPVFDQQSAMAALHLRGRAPNPAVIIARCRSWAQKTGNQTVLDACDAATKADS